MLHSLCLIDVVNDIKIYTSEASSKLLIRIGPQYLSALPVGLRVSEEELRAWCFYTYSEPIPFCPIRWSLGLPSKIAIRPLGIAPGKAVSIPRQSCHFFSCFLLPWCLLASNCSAHISLYPCRTLFQIHSTGTERGYFGMSAEESATPLTLHDARLNRLVAMTALSALIRTILQ